MSLPSRQQSFPLQVKRICRDSSFVTLMSFSAKLSLPARFFSHCLGSHGRTLNYFCNPLRTAKRYVTWLVSNHVWKSGCTHSNEISCNIDLFLTPLNPKQRYHATDKPVFGSGREVSCLSQNSMKEFSVDWRQLGINKVLLTSKEQKIVVERCFRVDTSFFGQTLNGYVLCHCKGCETNLLK